MYSSTMKVEVELGVAEPRDELISGSRLKLIGDLQHHPTNQQRLELKYSAVPPEEEFEIIREAGLGLTTNPKSVSVRLVEIGEYPVIVLEFVMKIRRSTKW